MSSTSSHLDLPEDPFKRALCLRYQQNPLLSLHAEFAFETAEKLGEGGMGVVFRVKDKRIDRDAALKLLQNSTPQSRERFLREAQITAQLDHPAIPPVYEIGMTTDGQLYLLMRLIKGQTLSELIRQYRDAGIVAAKRTELLQVLVKVSEAVAYAHSQGIVHRDLKPDNIMVGEFGEVLVMDWGIAKDLKRGLADRVLQSVLSEEELSQVGVTMSGAVVGTPGYMSPEQLEGSKVDGRADVFALGILLYELLSGERAMQVETTIELMAATLSGNLGVPSDYDASVSRELDWISSAAISVDVATRTQSASEFASQLQAVLSMEPVPRYQYSAFERVIRFAKKHPALVLGSCAILLFVALLLSLWLSLQAEREHSKRLALENRLELEEESKKRLEAESRANDAQAVLTLFNEARSLVGRGAPSAKIDEALKAALGRGQREEQELLTAARIYQQAKLGEPCRQLLNEIVKTYSPAYEALFFLHTLELEKSGEPYAYTDYLKEIVAKAKERGDVNEYVLYQRGNNLILEGKINEAIETYTEVEKYSTTLYWVYNNRGALYELKGLLDKAVADFDKAIELNPSFSSCYGNRAKVYMKRKDYESALRDYTKAIEINPETPSFHYGRGVVLMHLGRNKEAHEDFETLVRLDPKHKDGHLSRGSTFQKLGQLDKALQDYNTAAEINPKNWQVYFNRGCLFDKRKDYENALNDYSKAIDLNPKMLRSLYLRGLIHIRKNRFDEAYADLTRLLDANPKHLSARLNRAVALEKSRRYQESLADFKIVLKQEPTHAVAHFFTGNVYGFLMQDDMALIHYQRAIDLGHKDPSLYYNRGISYMKSQRMTEALADFDKAIELDPKGTSAYVNRGAVYQQLKNYGRALQDFNQVVRLNPKSALGYLNRGRTYSSVRMYKQALRDFSRVISLQEKSAVAYLYRGFTYLAMQNNRRALADLQQAIKLKLRPAYEQQARAAIDKIKASLSK